MHFTYRLLVIIEWNSIYSMGFMIYSFSFSFPPVACLTLKLELFFPPHLSLTCFLTKCLGFVFFCFVFLSVSFTTESRQYDIHSSQGKPSSFCASCDLWPSLGGQPQSISNYSSTISAHRHCSCSDETHFLWSAWRTGTWIFIQSIL